MFVVLAGLTAAGAAWLLNARLVRWKGEVMVIWVIPALEEGLKTGLSLLWGVSVFYAHLVFGSIEAVHDMKSSSGWGCWTGLASLLSHTAFGLITLVVYRWSSNWLGGIAAASLLHTFWNFSMVRLFAGLSMKKKEKKNGED